MQVVAGFGPVRLGIIMPIPGVIQPLSTCEEVLKRAVRAHGRRVSQTAALPVPKPFTGEVSFWACHQAPSVDIARRVSRLMGGELMCFGGVYALLNALPRREVNQISRHLLAGSRGITVPSFLAAGLLLQEEGGFLVPSLVRDYLDRGERDDVLLTKIGQTCRDRLDPHQWICLHKAA